MSRKCLLWESPSILIATPFKDWALAKPETASCSIWSVTVCLPVLKCQCLHCSETEENSQRGTWTVEHHWMSAHAHGMHSQQPRSRSRTTVGQQFCLFPFPSGPQLVTRASQLCHPRFTVVGLCCRDWQTECLLSSLPHHRQPCLGVSRGYFHVLCTATRILFSASFFFRSVLLLSGSPKTLS